MDKEVRFWRYLDRSWPKKSC